MIVSSVLSPEAVLHDEDEEEEDSSDKGGDTEAGEGVGDFVLDAFDTAGTGLSVVDAAGEVEPGGGADTGTVVLVLEEGNPLDNVVVGALASELLSERIEECEIGLGNDRGGTVVVLVSRLSVPLNAILVALDVTGGRSDEVLSSPAGLGVSLGARAVGGAHVGVDTERLVDVDADNDVGVLVEGDTVLVDGDALVSDSVGGGNGGEDGDGTDNDEEDPGGEENNSVHAGEATVLDAFEAEAAGGDTDGDKREDEKDHEDELPGVGDVGVLLLHLVEDGVVRQHEGEHDHEDAEDNCEDGAAHKNTDWGLSLVETHFSKFKLQSIPPSSILTRLSRGFGVLGSSNFGVVITNFG